jgi:dTDP-4-dehydrorhamnose reductase
VNRILITGKNGQVGWELRRTLAPLGEVVAVDVEDLDLTDTDAIRHFVREVKPTLIVNPAAYTAVDEAESEPEIAMAVNGMAPGALAEEANQLGALFVHYSTDYVFDGTKSGSYTEDDKPNPLNVYGDTKLAGERAVQAAGGAYLILRTSWVYGSRGKNFLLTMFRLAKEREKLKIVNDQIGAPTWSRHISDATGYIIQQAQKERVAGGFNSGIVNLTAAGETSWHGFASAIAAEARRRLPEGAVKTSSIEPIPTEAYPLPAARPRNSRLDNTKLMDRFGVALPHWNVALSTCMDEVR